MSLLIGTLAAITYPEIDPVIVEFGPFFGFGPFAIRWYSMAYIAGILFGWWYIRKLASKPGAAMSAQHIDDFITWAIIGIIAGGRLGYVLFYRPEAYFEDPLAILRLWDGGMSFHGGAIGVILAVIFFCRKHRLELMRVADIVAIVSPIGLLTGRIANFINGELWGRATDGSWAMIFPKDPLQVPRHPSQLYEAMGEGVILFLVLQYMYHRTRIAKEMPGVIAGVFYLGYGLTRVGLEFVREPDVGVDHIMGLTRGQLLSVPMFLFAAWLMNQGIQYKRAKQAGK